MDNGIAWVLGAVIGEIIWKLDIPIWPIIVMWIVYHIVTYAEDGGFKKREPIPDPLAHLRPPAGSWIEPPQDAS